MRSKYWLLCVCTTVTHWPAVSHQCHVRADDCCDLRQSEDGPSVTVSISVLSDVLTLPFRETYRSAVNPHQLTHNQCLTIIMIWYTIKNVPYHRMRLMCELIPTLPLSFHFLTGADIPALLPPTGYIYLQVKNNAFKCPDNFLKEGMCKSNEHTTVHS